MAKRATRLVTVLVCFLVVPWSSKNCWRALWNTAFQKHMRFRDADEMVFIDPSSNTDHGV